MSGIPVVRNGPKKQVVKVGFRGRVGAKVIGSTYDEDGRLIMTLDDGSTVDGGINEAFVDLQDEVGQKVDQSTLDSFASEVTGAFEQLGTASASDVGAGDDQLPTNSAVDVKIFDVAGIDEIKILAGELDPDRIEAARDADGELRVMKVIGHSGTVYYGAEAPLVSPGPTEFILFLTGGQSNMQGVGSSALSVSVPSGVAYQYYSGELDAVLGDPVGNASTGSCLPAFALEFYRRTGLGVIFVPSAVGSAGLTAAASAPAAGGNGLNWSSTGTLRGIAVDNVNAAIAAAESAGLAYRFGGVLWSQGERDARCLPSAGGQITEQDYIDEYQLLRAYFDSAFGGSKWPWIMSQTGGDAEGIDAAGLADMRELQRQMVQTQPNLYFGWTGAYNLIARDEMRDKDFPGGTSSQNRSHYSQQGYNEMGKAMAVVAASVSIGSA